MLATVIFIQSIDFLRNLDIIYASICYSSMCYCGGCFDLKVKKKKKHLDKKKKGKEMFTLVLGSVL